MQWNVLRSEDASEIEGEDSNVVGNDERTMMLRWMFGVHCTLASKRIRAKCLIMVCTRDEKGRGAHNGKSAECRHTTKKERTTTKNQMERHTEEKWKS